MIDGHVFNFLSTIQSKFIVIWTLIISSIPTLHAGVIDHTSRAFQIKHDKNYSMTLPTELSNITYLVELIALGLVAAALLLVTLSIMSRRLSAKEEYKKIKSLRLSSEAQKNRIDQILANAINIEEQLEKSITNTQSQLDELAKQSSHAEKSAREIKDLEDSIQIIASSVTERNKTKSTDALSIKSDEVSQTLEQALQNAKDLLTQINEYEQRAETAFYKFTNTLGNFESQAHGQFDDIFNAADIARQELNANIDESREYLKIFRGAKQKKKQLKNNASNNNLSLSSHPNKKPTLHAPHLNDEDLAGFFSKFRQRDSA